MAKRDTIHRKLLMTQEEGTLWNEFKAGLGPIYPGYRSFDTYMNWLKEKLKGYGCVDFLEHHWIHKTYRVKDWPQREEGVMKLDVEGKEIPVGTFVQLAPSTGPEGLTAPMVYYDIRKGEPDAGAFAGKIVVMEEPQLPQPPYDEKFLESYTITDTNYRSDPKPPADILECPDPSVSNSWATRWSFSSWAFQLVPYAVKGGAAGLLIASSLTYGTLFGLYDRQQEHMTALVIDREGSQLLLPAAKEGKTATMTLISQFFSAEAWNFVCWLPGKDYGTDRDQQISINIHVDAMSLTQDNGSLGLLGVVHYFSQLPQSERNKTLLLCIDCRHFIEGFERGNLAHDPYVVYPQIREKIVACLGLEHMGEMEGAADFERNAMVPTGRPEYTFMVADDNDYCADLLIRAAIHSGLERADIKIDGRPGLHGKYKGLVRAVQAKTHNLGVCVMGQAGNWCGAHTQTHSGMQYFGAKKFADEVALWTEVVQELMDTHYAVYHIAWADLNTAIRSAAKTGEISPDAKEGLLMGVASLFREAEKGDYTMAAVRLEHEIISAAEYLKADGIVQAAWKVIAMLKDAAAK